ncbi:glycosyltransferase GT10J15 [Spatholobus suberectus]|nr:glycosyltransferase GT10J15 [Spatholobus suberectus]
MEPPQGFPDSCIKFRAHELKFLVATRKLEFGSGVLLYDRWGIGEKRYLLELKSLSETLSSACSGQGALGEG